MIITLAVELTSIDQTNIIEQALHVLTDHALPVTVMLGEPDDPTMMVVERKLRST